jgi:two-component system sensor histidine kinase KdpD
MNATRGRAVVRFLAVAVPTVVIATIVVGFLQDVLGVPNPSAVYLVAVVATAIVSGTAGAIATAVASFVLYNFLFTEPRYTLSMHEPGVWLSVVLLLFVGVVVGQLAALQRDRAEVAHRRAREARAMFTVSRALATRETIDAVLTEIARQLESEANMERVVITTGTGDSSAVGFDTRGVINQLRRTPGSAPAAWVRVHVPGTRSGHRVDDNAEVYRVLIESSNGPIGSIWALRARSAGLPGAEQTRLLAAAADQLGQAIAHDRMAAASHAAEVARESDALKSALLQSVSHDLRTPLATIRAAAGTLRPGANADAASRRESVEAIDREVDYLNRLVSNLLDLSRIEAGVLRAAIDTFELDDLVRATLERLGPRLAGWVVKSEVSTDVVQADPVFFDAALTNLLENALRHTPTGTTIRLTSASEAAVADADGIERVRLTIADSGPGVPDQALAYLFDKFYRVPERRPTRSGTGIGLAVARGLIDQMGGRITARHSELGGLAIDIQLRAARVPAELRSTVSSA